MTTLMVKGFTRGLGVNEDRVRAIDRGKATALPRSLHYATRRTKTVRKKKPGRFGRDDRKGGAHTGAHDVGA